MSTNDIRITLILYMHIPPGFDFGRSCCESGAVTPLHNTYSKRVFSPRSYAAQHPQQTSVFSTQLRCPTPTANECFLHAVTLPNTYSKRVFSPSSYDEQLFPRNQLVYSVVLFPEAPNISGLEHLFSNY